MTKTLDLIDADAPLRLEPLSDRVTDAFGHDPRSLYVERFWLPVLGPSTTWLLRFFVGKLDRHPEGVSIDIAEAARSLGIGERLGRHGPFLRSTARAIDFDMARVTAPRTLGVRKLLPTLSGRHLVRLPRSLQVEHLNATLRVGSAAEPIERRGRRLALSLLDLGEDPEDALERLSSWKFPPALAHECVDWAMAERVASLGTRAATPQATVPGG